MLALATGCGRGEARGTSAEAAPERAGEVWEVDSAANRATAGAALQAYVHGLHVVVLDGDDAYAGMTRLHAERAADGVRHYRLADGTAAQLAPAGAAFALRFADGGTVRMRRQPDRRQTASR